MYKVYMNWSAEIDIEADNEDAAVYVGVLAGSPVELPNESE